jgi:hypothetical protein
MRKPDSSTIRIGYCRWIAAGKSSCRRIGKSVPFQLYYGPSDYNVLKKQAPDMDKIVNLGRDLYSFVRPINKYIIMNVFDFFAGFVKNMAG